MLFRCSLFALLAATSSVALAEVSSQSVSATFDECLATQAKVIAQLNVPPSQIIHVVNTSVMTVTRLCTADGSVLVSCSKPDEKMIVTKSDKSC